MKHSLLSLAFAALLVSTSALAQAPEDMSLQQPVTEIQAIVPESGESAGIPAGAVGASVKFTNDGANRPVLETLTPDAEGIALDPAAADAVAQMDTSLHAVEHIDESAGLPQFDVKTFPKQIFWLTLVFVFLYFVNAKAVLPALTRTIDGRAARIAADIDAAQASRNEAERMRDEYEAAIANAQSQGQKTLQDLQTRIKADIEAQGAEFKGYADAKITALEERIDASKAAIMDELSVAAADLTVDIAQSVAGIKADDKAAKEAIDSLNTVAKAA